MKIKQIFDEINSVSGDKAKMAILDKYKDNDLLKEVLYLCKSKRVKYYLKQLPDYEPDNSGSAESLAWGIHGLVAISDREYTGHDATKWLQTILSGLDADDAYIIERIIDKDPKIGLGTTFINKVFGEYIEDTPYMGAISFDEKKAKAIFNGGKKGVSQIKMDGRYCNAIITDGFVELESRSGEPTILTDAFFLTELSKFDNCVLNGELTIKGVPRYESNGIIASLIDICGKRGERSYQENFKKVAAFEKKHGPMEEWINRITYTVWDTITNEEYLAKKSNVPYSKRLANCRNLLIKAGDPLMVNLIESRVVSSYAEAMAHFQEVLATEVDGVPQEGTILKAIDGEWKDGKPVWQIKMKLEMNVDLRITGFNYGKKGTKNEHVISSFNAESEDGKIVTSPQGLTEEMMKYVTENQDKLLSAIIETKCNGLSKDVNGNYSLLYPAFKYVRDDKTKADTLEDVIKNENMVKNLI